MTKKLLLFPFCSLAFTHSIIEEEPWIRFLYALLSSLRAVAFELHSSRPLFVDTASMEVLWSRFKSVYPYTPSRYDGVMLGDDDDVEKLKQPLIGRESLDEDDVDMEGQGYYHYRQQQPQCDGGGYDDDRDDIEYAKKQHHKSYMMSVEPKFLRSLGKLTELAASTFSASSSQAKQKNRANEDYTATNSAQTVNSIRSMVRTRRRKNETMEDMTEKALAKMAMLTVACSVLLILAVCAHAS